jgi:hypothetical protein
LNGCNVGITEGRYFINCAVEMGLGGIIYMQSFMKIGTYVQAILRGCLRNPRGCNVGVTDERDL